MKPKYILTKRAEQDLTSIWRYTAETWSQKQANKYIQAILTAFLKIAKAPTLVGRSYEHVRRGYRKYPSGKHVIFYRIMADGIAYIVRILHEKMDFDKHV